MLLQCIYPRGQDSELPAALARILEFLQEDQTPTTSHDCGRSPQQVDSAGKRQLKDGRSVIAVQTTITAAVKIAKKKYFMPEVNGPIIMCALLRPIFQFQGNILIPIYHFKRNDKGWWRE